MNGALHNFWCSLIKFVDYIVCLEATIKNTTIQFDSVYYSFLVFSLQMNDIDSNLFINSFLLEIESSLVSKDVFIVTTKYFKIVNVQGFFFKLYLIYRNFIEKMPLILIINFPKISVIHKLFPFTQKIYKKNHQCYS